MRALHYDASMVEWFGQTWSVEVVDASLILSTGWSVVV